jgi:hypothetical protein
MSVSTEVQRTLVKSPPELWAELGNQEGLARHLGEIGEIRVTKVVPESKVEWEADQASGVVQLKQSGWGTKVTLSLTRELPEAETAYAEPASDKATNAAEPEPSAAVESESAEEPTVKPAPEPVAAATLSEPAAAKTQAEPVANEPQPEPAAESDADSPPEPEPADEPAAEPEPEPAAVQPQPESEPAIEAPPEPTAVAPEPEPASEPVASEPAPKQGFFARLFKRRRPAIVVSEPATEAVPEAIADETPEPESEFLALAAPEPIYPEPPPKPVEPEPSADLAAELAQLEAQLQQESTELLTGVLDRLGAAHHRPFSRG